MTFKTLTVVDCKGDFIMGGCREIAPHVQLEHISITEDQVLQIQEQMRKVWHEQFCLYYQLECFSCWR